MVSVRKTLPLVAAATVLALGLASCSGSGADGGSGESETYDVYLNLPVTGALAASSQAAIDAVNVAADAINAEGGILGREIVVQVADNGLDPTKGVSLMQEQLDKSAPDLVFTGATSNETLALAPLLTRERILSMALNQATTLNDPATYPYLFLANQGPADAPYIEGLLEERGVEKVALLTANDANGQATSESFASTFSAAGIEVVIETYSPTDIDMTSQLQRLQAQDPDVLVFQGFGAAVGYILSSKTKLGWDVTAIGHSSIADGQDLSTISSPADWENLDLVAWKIISSSWDKNPEQLAEFVDALKAEGSKVDQPMAFYSFYWDCLWLAKAAAEQAGAVDADAMKAALEDLEPSEYDDRLLTFDVMRWTADNHFFDVAPEDAFVVVKPGPIVDGVIREAE